MKKMAILGVAIACAVFFTASAQAADKLGYVDLGKLFDEYNKTKDYDKVLEGKQNTYEGEREKKVNDVKQLQSKIEILSEKEKEAKKPDLESKIKDLQEFDRLQMTDLRKERDEKMKEILKDIEKAVGEYASKQGYTLIFNDRVLVYQDKNLDITDNVLKILQGYYKSK
jgi:Skp family chaperone for outer membrane proteins